MAKKIIRAKTEDERKEALRLHQLGNSCYEISRVLDISRSTIQRWVKHPDRLLKNYWTEEEINFLRDHYPTSDKSIILLGLPDKKWQSICVQANRLGIVRQDVYSKSILDFTTIDTEEKAYILGFLAADGCILTPKQCKGCYVLSIDLSIRDLKLLEDIRDIIYPNGKVRVVEKQQMAIFSLGDKVLCKQLISHGIVPRKTFVVEVPKKLPKSLLRHWVRGYFDGDGSVSVSVSQKHRVISAEINGQPSVLDYIDTEFKRKHQHTCKLGWTGTCYRYSYGGKTALAFLEWIYAGSIIRLERKINKYIEFKDTVKIGNYKEWTKEEEDTLSMNFFNFDNRELSQLFPGRSLSSILSKATKLGLRRKK